MDISYSTASDQWNAFALVFIFVSVMGILAGGLWEQLTRKTTEEGNFWPTSFKKIAWSTIIGGLLGAWIGSVYALQPIYKITCRQDRLSFWSAYRSYADDVDSSQIAEVRRRLVSAGGGNPWTIRIYKRDGYIYETARISDAHITKELDRVRKCVSTPDRGPDVTGQP